MQIRFLGRYLSCEFLDFIKKFDLTDKQSIMFCGFQYRIGVQEVIICLHFH